MSEQPTNNSKIAYSDETGDLSEKIEFVKQSEVKEGDSTGQRIYTMPKAFRFKAKSSSGNNKTGLAVMAIGVLLLAVLVYVGYRAINQKPIFDFNPTNTTENQANQPTTTPTSTDQQAVENESGEIFVNTEDPEQVYLQLRLKLDQALTLKDYLNIFAAGASQAKAHQILEQSEGLDSLSESQAANTLSISRTMMIELSPTDQITKEINGDTATLTITKQDGQIAIVKMVKESGAWKFDDEQKQAVTTQPIVTVEPEASSTPSSTIDVSDDLLLDTDTDQDGLTDKEETIFGTNANQADSDSDGYADLAEIRSGYNPIGQDKISKNKGLVSVKHGKWSVLAPATWNSQLGKDDSAIFRASDNQFVQLVTLPKKSSQELAEWYQEMFDGQTADVMVVDGRQVAVSPDGLVFYVTQSRLDYIVSLTYNPEETKLLSYSNILRLMASSLVFNK
ncbi:MAG TPA: hypothetical protein PKN62_00370 [bacterium]|nr:hypothetical protein [bacterium]